MNSGIASRVLSAFRPMALLLAASAALTACGGGETSPSATSIGPDVQLPSVLSAPPSVNVHAAYMNLVRQPHTFTLTGSTSLGVPLAAAMSVVQGPQRYAYGSVVDTATVTTLLYSAGTLRATAVLNAWQDVGSPNWLVTFSPEDSTCIVRIGGSALPAVAILGTTGPYLSGTQYAGCTAGNLPTSVWAAYGSVVQTWAYTLLDNVPYVCINTATTSLLGKSTESDCIEVLDTNGTLGTRVRIKIADVNGVTTTLSN